MIKIYIYACASSDGNNRSPLKLNDCAVGSKEGLPRYLSPIAIINNAWTLDLPIYITMTNRREIPPHTTQGPDWDQLLTWLAQDHKPPIDNGSF